jgi:tetratricopeptide (TPR) repeat protein
MARPFACAAALLAWLSLGAFAGADAADWRAWERYLDSAQRAVEQGRLVGAEGWLLEAVREAEQQDRRDPRLTQTLTALAEVYRKQGRERDAQAIERRLGAAPATPATPATSPELLASLGDYARLLRELGRDTEAFKVQAKAQRWHQVQTGQGTGELLFFNPVAELRDYARLLRQRQRDREAVAMERLAAAEARKLIERYEKLRRGFTSGPLPSITWLQQVTGGEEALEGRLFPEAEALFADAVRSAETFPPDDVRRAYSLSLLALAQRASGKLPEFASSVQRAMPIVERAAGTGHSLLPSTLGALAVAHLRFDWDPALALAHLRRALPVLEKAVQRDHPILGLHRAGLGACQLALGQPQLAAPEIERALEIAAQPAQPGQVWLAFGLMRVVDEYLRVQDYARADIVVRRLVALLRQMHDPEHPDVADALQVQRLVQSRLRQPGEAVTLGAATSVPLQLAGNAMLVRALVNQHHRALMVVDTGASVTLVRPLVLTRLGVTLPADAPRRRMTVVSGATMDVPFLVLSVQVGEARIDNLLVAVVEAFPGDPDLDGLLGSDFLNRFKVGFDQGGRLMTLTPLAR